ncbi:MAG: hypothetical protein IBJ00_00715 [Alphaproteobacteria bacterium]|nr:hypothetical protein [Alphaproteobacteria bacterium]
MKFNNGYFLVSLAILSSVSLQSSEIIEDPNPTKKNCSIILKRIEEIKNDLESLKSKNGQVPIIVKSNYEDYIRVLFELHKRAETDESMNVNEELYYASNKFF